MWELDFNKSYQQNRFESDWVFLKCTKKGIYVPSIIDISLVW